MAQTQIGLLMTLSETEFVSQTNIWVRNAEMLQPDAFCEHTMQQNATAAGASPRTTLGEHTALPQTS